MDLPRSYLNCAKNRKVVPIIYTWSALICLILSIGGIPPIIGTLKLLTAVTFVAYSVYFFNDLRDIEDDLKNLEMGNSSHSKRPLLSGKISKSLILKFAIFSGILGLSTAITINIQVFLAQLLYLVLGILYSQEPIRLKKRFFMKQLTIASGHVLATISGALLVGVINPPTIFLAALNFAIALGVNPLLDIRDLRGDRVMGITTIPVVFGPTQTVRFAIATSLSIAAASVLGYSQLGFHIVVPILSIIILAALIYSIYPIIRRWDEPDYVNLVIFNRFLPLFVSLQLVPVVDILSF